MSEYTPDVWVVLEFDTPNMKEPLRKVFGGWYGGFAGSNSWKLNSGITQVRIKDGRYEFDGYSGSTYYCHANNYHMSGLMMDIYSKWLKEADLRGDVSIKILQLDEIVET